MYEVIVLKEGYSSMDDSSSSQMKASGSSTLLKGPQNIIVDTGNPWDRDLILERLLLNGISPEQISYVVCSSGHVDKVGNLNLFPKASHIVGFDLCVRDQFYFHEFDQQGPRLLQKTSSVISTHLHSHSPDSHYFRRVLLAHLDFAPKFLMESGVKPETIAFVVCTHGHSDHVGNLNLFPNAIYIVGYDICHGDQYLLHGFDQGIPYEIDENVEVFPTPGHTGADVSVIVRNTSQGTVIIAGDLFECEDDLENPHLWQQNSENPELQQKSRLRVLKKADHIVPGHGGIFKVPEIYKTQPRSVLIYEEFTHTWGANFSETVAYNVIEVD